MVVAGTAVSGYAIHMYGRHHGAPIRLILRLKGILRRLIPRLQGLLLQFKRLLRRLLGRPALFPFSFRILVNLQLFLQILEHVSHETGAKALVLLIIRHCRIELLLRTIFLFLWDNFSPCVLHFPYIGGYSTNIGFRKHIPIVTEGSGTLLLFPILVE